MVEFVTTVNDTEFSLCFNVISLHINIVLNKVKYELNSVRGSK